MTETRHQTSRAFRPPLIETMYEGLQDANEQLRRQYQERVELEVQRSLDYVGRQFHYIPVHRLMISVPEGTGLEMALAEHLDLPVERLDLLQVMDISAVPELARSEYAVEALHAIGAALRQERRTL